MEEASAYRANEFKIEEFRRPDAVDDAMRDIVSHSRHPGAMQVSDSIGLGHDVA